MDGLHFLIGSHRYLLDFMMQLIESTADFCPLNEPYFVTLCWTRCHKQILRYHKYATLK